MILINVVCAVAYPTLINSILSLVLYFCLVIHFYKKNNVAILLFSAVIFLHISVVISLIAIESGAFMMEMGRYGYASSSSAVYVAIISLFLTAGNHAFSSKKTKLKLYKIENHPFIFKWCALFFCGFVVVYMILAGLKTGFPLLQGFDRFAYRYAVNDALLTNFLVLKILIVSFLGVAANNCPSKKKIFFHLTFLGYILTSFLFADKFFIIIITSLIYMATQVVSSPEVLKRYSKAFFIIATLAIFTSTLVTYYIYSGHGLYTVDATLNRLAERFAEQGQLWFVQYNEGFTWINFDLNAVLNNIESIYTRYPQNFCFENKIGAFYFMPKYAPYNIYMSFSRNGGTVTPTMAFEPYLLSVFGIVGVVALVSVFGFIYGKIALYLFNTIRSRNPFEVLLPAYLLIQCNSVANTGTISNLVNIQTSFKAYLAIYILQIIVRKYLTYIDYGREKFRAN